MISNSNSSCLYYCCLVRENISIKRDIYYDIMQLPHKCEKEVIEVESKEGQRTLLCGNKVPSRCPSLAYEQSTIINSIDHAFELLFNEVIKSKNSVYENNQFDSNLR